MLLIFDLDGTVIDSRSEIEHTFERAFMNLGMELDKKKLMKAVGYPLEEVVYNLVGKYDDRVIKEIRKLYFGMDKRMIKLFPGIMQVLQVSNHTKSVLTSKRRKTAMRDMQYLGILDLFDVVVGADDVEKKKPDGEGVRKIAEKLKFFDFNRIYMIGDTEVDILTARNAGVKSIAVTWGFRTEEELKKYKPDYIAREPEDIKRILQSEIE